MFSGVCGLDVVHREGTSLSVTLIERCVVGACCMWLLDVHSRLFKRIVTNKVDAKLCCILSKIEEFHSRCDIFATSCQHFSSTFQCGKHRHVDLVLGWRILWERIWRFLRLRCHAEIYTPSCQVWCVSVGSEEGRSGAWPSSSLDILGDGRRERYHESAATLEADVAARVALLSSTISVVDREQWICEETSCLKQRLSVLCLVGKD